MAKVIWTEPALKDLSRIYDYLATQSQSFDTAERICNELLTASEERLSIFPAAGNLVPEGQQYGAREIYKHSYRIIYVTRGEACYVVRCIHGSRDLARHLDPTDWPAIE
jgi:plasmid stabilization system protein ParE